MISNKLYRVYCDGIELLVEKEVLDKFCLIPDQQPYRRMGYTATRFKNSLKSFENGFYISNSPSLTHEDKSYIINSIKKGLR